jgi:hypothetical protein
MYAELSLTVPITNSMAFLFTVIGEWWVERKVIGRGKLCDQTGCIDADSRRYMDRYDSVIMWNWVMCTE